MKKVKSGSPEFREEMQSLNARRLRVMDEFAPQADQLIQRFRQEKSKLIHECAIRFDQVDLKDSELFVSEDLIRNSHKLISPETKRSIEHARHRIEQFQDEFKISSFETEYESGILLGAQVRSCSRVGVYVPGGPLSHFLSLLLCAVPARKAGVKEIVVATPPRSALKPTYIEPSLLYVAKLLDISEILLSGGPVALAAMTFGFDKFAPVEKIVGSGSKLTSVAKMRLSGYVGVDGFEGPAETAFICDRNTSVEVVASDMIGRAGRDPEGHLFVFHQDDAWFEKLVMALGRYTSAIQDLQAQSSVRTCLQRSTAFFQTKNMDESIQISNQLAPGVVCLLMESPEKLIPKIQSCGSLLLGPYTSSVAMDVLGAPSGLVETMGSSSSSLSMSPPSFMRRFSVIEFTKEALSRVESEELCLANEEHDQTHDAAIKARLT